MLLHFALLVVTYLNQQAERKGNTLIGSVDVRESIKRLKEERSLNDALGQATISEKESQTSQTCIDSLKSGNFCQPQSTA